jgi:hypothetical protein
MSGKMGLMFKNSKIAEFALIFCFCVLCGNLYGNDNKPPEIVEVVKIWDTAPHSAFTDLIRFKGKWLCTFREADNHAGGQDGKIRVIVSEDGDKWKSSALLAEDGVDLRDPKISITPDGKLMLLTTASSVFKRRL